MTPYSKRRRCIREWLQATDVDAVLITSPQNVRYLFGFSGEGIGVIGDTAVLSTDRRYELEAAAVPGRVAIELDPDGHLAGAIARLRTLGVRRVAFEAETTTYASFESLRAKLKGVKLVPARQVVERLRAIKDKTEIATITRAAAIMDEALQAVIPRLKPGKSTERQVALDLERAALLAGAEAIAFPTILAFGPSAAHPHAVPGDRVLERGQVVKVDCGARVDGYCADITRTFVVGRPDAQTREVYTAVFDAQAAALGAARAGLKACELDAVARTIITERGFGHCFSHGLGHGVGLQVHELPRLGARSQDILQAGMVVTIEPGIYIEGWGGVRIEDTVVITNTGHEPLTRAPKPML